MTTINYWKITSPEEIVIEVTFEDIDIESSSGCVCDFLLVLDGPSKANNDVERVFGQSKPDVIRSSTSEILLIPG